MSTWTIDLGQQFTVNAPGDTYEEATINARLMLIRELVSELAGVPADRVTWPIHVIIHGSTYSVSVEKPRVDRPIGSNQAPPKDFGGIREVYFHPEDFR